MPAESKSKLLNCLRKYLSCRKPASHKGNFGRIFIVAGSAGMSGACVLAGEAALRSGAGLVTLGVPSGLMEPIAEQMKEVMTFPLRQQRSGTIAPKAQKQILDFLKNQDVLAIGPGLRQYPEVQSVIRAVILRSTKPMVIDADGLNAFGGKPWLLKSLKAAAICTPHPGEFFRLFGTRPKGDEARKRAAVLAAKTYSVVIVLKGHRTVVAAPDGSFFINSTGNPGMATAGSGDVLTGMISALLGQGLPPFWASAGGVYIHGLAGDLAAKRCGEISLIARDLIACLPDAFKRSLRRQRRSS